MRKKLALTEILMHLHRRKETWGLHRVLHSKESRLISDVMMSEEGIEDLMILVLLLDTLVIIIPILRGTEDMTEHIIIEERINPGSNQYYQELLAQTQITSVARHRPLNIEQWKETDHLLMLQSLSPHHQGGDLRNVIAPPVIDTGNANNALEVTPTRTIKDRLGIATNTRIGTNSGSRERRSALERLSDPIPARRPPSFESGRLQEADSRPVETMQTEQDTVEEQLPEERVPATLRIGSITRSKRGEIPVASQSKATTKRRVTNPTKKRVLRSPILRLSQRTSPVARSATTTRRKLVVEKDKDVPCNKAGTSRQRSKSDRPTTVCRRGIIQWSKEKQAQSNLVIKQNQEALEGALSSATPDVLLIESLNSKLREAYTAEEQYWQQRSRIQWLKKGDRNTGFFHAATRTRRVINSIPVIEDSQGGAVYEEQQIVGPDSRTANSEGYAGNE
ncbi:hypothetical protein Rs2_11623 [Raphanus sativus]|nr:hypothetical protein Rs2_11623 [Raphanus sativus]